MHRLIRVDLHRARTVCFGVAAGTTMPVTAGVLIVATTILTSAITAWASALPAVQNEISQWNEEKGGAVAESGAYLYVMEWRNFFLLLSMALKNGTKLAF